MRRALVGALALAFLVAAPVAAGGSSITYSPASPTTATGVSFDVTTGGGNRDYATVEVSCTDGTSVVYATTLTVVVPPKGTGTSQRVYPPASTCTGNLVKSMSIGKARLLATTGPFPVTQAP